MLMDAVAKSTTGRGAVLALLSFGTFASHDAIIKTLGGTYAVFQIIFFAVLFAFVPVTIMLAADRKLDNLRPHHPWLLAARTASMLLAMACAFHAFTVLPLAETYALLFATPLLVTALSVPLLGETVRLRRWIAVLIGLVGVLIVLRPGYGAFTSGHATALVAATCSAFSAIIVRRIGPEERSAVLMLYPMLANIALMACVLPWVYVPMPIEHLGLAASVGLLASIGQVLIIAAYRAAPAALVAPFQYSQILWAVPYGYLLFGDRPDVWVAAGASVIIASGLFIVWRESRADVSVKNPILRNRNLRPDVGPTHKPRPGDSGHNG